MSTLSSTLTKATPRKIESPWAQARRRFFAGRQGPFGLAILGFIFLLVLIGPLFAPYRVGEIPKPSEYVFLGRGPSLEHIFGETAQLQLDVFMLVVNGGRASLFIGFAAAVGSITIGTLVGIIAGYFGGKLDSFLMRLVDVFLAIPSLFVIIVGFGVSALTPTWGNMLSNAEDFLLQGNWWWLGFPGMFIIMTSLSVNMIGDALRESLEPEGRRS